eukprot:432010-Amphidinium_carterae.1
MRRSPSSKQREARLGAPKVKRSPVCEFSALPIVGGRSGGRQGGLLKRAGGGNPSAGCRSPGGDARIGTDGLRIQLHIQLSGKWQTTLPGWTLMAVVESDVAAASKTQPGTLSVRNLTPLMFRDQLQRGVDGGAEALKDAASAEEAKQLSFLNGKARSPGPSASVPCTVLSY